MEILFLAVLVILSALVKAIQSERPGSPIGNLFGDDYHARIFNPAIPETTTDYPFPRMNPPLEQLEKAKPFWLTGSAAFHNRFIPLSTIVLFGFALLVDGWLMYVDFLAVLAWVIALVVLNKSHGAKFDKLLKPIRLTERNIVLDFDALGSIYRIEAVIRYNNKPDLAATGFIQGYGMAEDFGKYLEGDLHGAIVRQLRKRLALPTRDEVQGYMNDSAKAHWEKLYLTMFVADVVRIERIIPQTSEDFFEG